MVFGWRRAFCTSVPREPDSDSSVKSTKHNHNHDSVKCNTPKFGSRFVFFSSSSSNPSTPRLQVDTDSSPNLRCRTRKSSRTTSETVQEKSASVPVSPRLRCKTSNNPKLFQWSSTPSSPRSPSTFSLLKSNLRLSTNRCGLCSESVKSGRGVAIYTAECSHSFHFPCIAGYVKEKGSLACPVCGTLREETPVFSINKKIQNHHKEQNKPNETVDVVNKKSKLSKQNSFKPDLKVYNDDEPIGLLTPKGGFNPIPESDETCDEDSIEEFQGFHTDNYSSPFDANNALIEVDVRLLPEAAVISTAARGGYETYAIVLRAKALSMQQGKTEHRAPIDLVTVIDVSGKVSNEQLQMMKRTMRTIISSLSSTDRLSIVAFSSYSKRLLYLKRMTSSGQRAARRIVEAMAVLEGSSNASDAVKKAAKVLDDRREKNTVASIFLLSDVSGQSSHVSTTRYQNVAVHTLKPAVSDDHAFVKTIRSLLTVTVQDLQLELGLASDSLAEIVSVYSHAPRAVVLGSRTGTGTGTGTEIVSIGELCENEERELLIELKVPASAVGVHTVLSVRCSYRESETQEVIYCKEQELVVPRPQTVRSSSVTIQRLRSLFITTRALAESRVLTARSDLIGAYHTLVSARALLNQASSGCSEFMVSVEAELNELQRRRLAQAERVRVEPSESEPLTPVSAWRVAEKLAKVAMMRKTLNRVSDLHGFEDARF